MKLRSKGRQALRVSAVAILATFAAASTAQAHHVIGISVSLANKNSVTRTADINITESTTGAGTVGGADVHWGDANTTFAPWATTSGTGPKFYRVSTSHVYPDTSSPSGHRRQRLVTASFGIAHDTVAVDLDASPAPMAGCHNSATSQLHMKDSVDNTKDQMQWKWSKGDDTSPASLGDPTADTEYYFCIYAPGLVEHATVPAGRRQVDHLGNHGLQVQGQGGNGCGHPRHRGQVRIRRQGQHAGQGPGWSSRRPDVSARRACHRAAAEQYRSVLEPHVHRAGDQDQQRGVLRQGKTLRKKP